MLTEENYLELSQDVYRIDPKHLNYDPNLRVSKTIDVRDFQYKILKVESNTVNGMQAMAVAPAKNNIVDTSEII